MKLIAILIVTLNIVIVRADISLKLSASNQFEGYSYPKPKTPFITGNVKNFEPETTPRPTTPRTTTTRAPTTTPLVKVKADIFEKSGYDYPKPRIPFELPKPKPRIQVNLVTETIPSTYLPPTVAETYLPPVVTTTPKRTTRTTTTRTTTTRPPLRDLPPFESDGYKYDEPKLRFNPSPKVDVKVTAETVPPSTYLPPLAETYLPPETTRLTTTRTTTTRRTTTTTSKPSLRTLITKEGYDYPQPEIPFTLPQPTPKVRSRFTAETVPPTVAQTYLPPVVETTKRIITTTTTRRPTTTTRKTTVTPVTKRNLIVDQGYDYKKPSVRTQVKEDIIPVTYLPPTVAETYLPPATTRVTTPRTTTTRTTTRQTTTKPPLRSPPLEEEKEGYNYPVPKVRFDLPKPTPKVNVRVTAETIPVTYLPPTVPKTTTTRRTTRLTTTTKKPTLKTLIEKKQGYDYPKPEIEFNLPKPTPKINVRVTAETLPVTYLPPVTSTTTRPLTRRTTTPTSPPVTEKKIKKEGYDYPTPKKAFTLPPKERIFIEQDVPVTYLPPLETTKIVTTSKPSTRTTRQTVTSPKPTQFKIVVSEEKEGYEIPKPKNLFPPPSERIGIKSDFLPTIPSTYLPPETTTKVVTTRKTTTRPATVRTPPRERKLVEKEGYDYPKPRIPFPPATEKTIIKEESVVPVTYLPPVAETYLPPFTSRTTQRATTTRRPTTASRTTTPVLRTLPTVPSTYLPPEIYVPPVTSTTRRTPTTTTSRKIVTTPAAPKVRISDEVETGKGYDYPQPEIPFTLPQPTPRVRSRFTAETVPPTVAQTYLPPAVETTKKIFTTTTTRRPTTTTTTRKTTVTTVTKRNLIVDEGYDYKKPSVRTRVKEDSVPVTYLPPTVPSTYLPPVEETTKRIITTTRRPTTTTRKTTVTPVTKRNLIVDEGYDYKKPSVRTRVKEDSVPVTYLPPVEETTTTTRRPTTRKTTTRPPTTTTVILKTPAKEGYDYPKPSIPFELPKPTERISVKSVQVPTVPSTYLPPIVTTTTTSTTPRPSTEKVITNYLPPEEPKGYFYDKPSIPFFY